MKEIVTVNAIANRYGCDRHYASSIIKKIPHFRVGKMLKAYAEDLEEWERGQMVFPIKREVRQPKQIQFVIPRRKAE